MIKGRDGKEEGWGREECSPGGGGCFSNMGTCVGFHKNNFELTKLRYNLKSCKQSWGFQEFLRDKTKDNGTDKQKQTKHDRTKQEKPKTTKRLCLGYEYPLN